VGGDGTLHHIVNGLMQQTSVENKYLKLAVIPVGTGNDWVKTYNIPKNIKKAIAIIQKENSVLQDLGYIQLHQSNKTKYFNNMAGIGFDGFVVNSIYKYKKYGSLAYLIGTIVSFLNYKKSSLTIKFDKTKISSKSLLAVVGICKFSGGGMQLTQNVDYKDGLFDVSIAKNFKFLSILLNIRKFYNGKITDHKEVDTYKTSQIDIFSEDLKTFIQADGELIGQGGFKATLLPNALRFIVP
jgi:YegS/Rv2252/BmrU family lipid kinase